MPYQVLEICAGAGGQAIGLEAAGFEHVAAVEIDAHACATLRLNRPQWQVFEGDVHSFDGSPYKNSVDLLAGGVPCPPFSVAGKQLGGDDERDLFPEALRLVSELQPRAVMLENVQGFASAKFNKYREGLFAKLRRLGYTPDLKILSASDFGVPQLRPRTIIIALRQDDFTFFRWPERRDNHPAPTVGQAVGEFMAAGGWPGATAWKARASAIAPTIVGGSKKHGGPDLGPTRARVQWARLAVNGLGVADEPPGPDFPADAMPKLTVKMVARIQGFPDDWRFVGRKTASYRQVGNAFPPPVAEAVGRSIVRAFEHAAQPVTAEVQGRIFDRRHGDIGIR